MNKSITNLNNKKQGFTIVELLVVIVVIAILAAVSIAAYTGIQNRANDSAVQSDLNQLYKQIQASQVTDEFVAEDTAKINTLLNNVSADSYETSNGFPLIVVPSRDWETGETSYDLAGVSKSGKVFYISKATGGVTRAIANWAEYRSQAESDITFYNELLANDEYEYTQADREWFNQYIIQRQNDIQAYTQSEAQGKDMWSLMKQQNSSYCYQDSAYADRICMQSYQVPVGSTETHQFGGYVFDPNLGEWVSIWGAWAI